MRTTTKAVAAAALATMALAGCEVSVGNAAKVPEYVEVESEGVTLEVVKGMVESDVPEGFDAFWQNHDGGALVSAGIALYVDESTFVADQAEQLEGVMTDFTTKKVGQGALSFEGIGVDDDTYTGLIAVRDGIGVVTTAGEGIAPEVTDHIVDSVQAADGSGDVASEETPGAEEDTDALAEEDTDALAEEDTDALAEEDAGEYGAEGPVLTTVWTQDDLIMVDVLEGMQEVNSSGDYNGMWQTPAGYDPQVTVSVTADVDPQTFIQQQATEISGAMTDPEELSESEDRYVFMGTGVDDRIYTVVVGVNGSVGVAASSSGTDVSILHDIVDSAW